MVSKQINKDYTKFLRQIQKSKMRELWDNECDDDWKNV